MIAIYIIFYVLMSILTTWFNYEMLKQLTESGKRKVTDSYYISYTSWNISHESMLYCSILLLNLCLWPIATPLLWIIEYFRKTHHKILQNPMRYAVKEILSPRDNV